MISVSRLKEGQRSLLVTGTLGGLIRDWIYSVDVAFSWACLKVDVEKVTQQSLVDEKCHGHHRSATV